ncbi:MAG: 4-(cytidine 5'-diphospho)-2-C-methyl-D-erythritol kinase, partial [Rubripirellula sp.]|nr:4-(cytidine 5'-diphospho)-2-C-methyl-D-erythritol kinase [Rubripirellula sp.]
MSNPAESAVARTYPPAKLNLFLELLDRREDGYHEIDTVMVPVNWCDELRIRATAEAGIRLQVDWSPSLSEVARQLQIDPGGELAKNLLHLPTDESNLVYRALDRFQDCFSVGGGFEVQLSKQIPAGAGMGGASSDAASALRCAAVLHQVPLTDPQLRELAAEIGSDVPFFMGIDGLEPIAAARGTGRGEHLRRLDVADPVSAVVVYPAISLST